jgi:hypothetical protein
VNQSPLCHCHEDPVRQTVYLSSEAVAIEPVSAAIEAWLAAVLMPGQPLAEQCQRHPVPRCEVIGPRLKNHSCQNYAPYKWAFQPSYIELGGLWQFHHIVHFRVLCHSQYAGWLS